MMSVQAMLMITVVLLSLIYQGNSQSCYYLFRNIAPNHERDYGNSAYEKGEYSSVLYCGKFCARDTNCAGFIRFRDPQRTKQGKISCVFVNTYSTGKDVFENVHADYFQRETIGSSSSTINSAQFYASDNKLVVNTDSHALVYKITDINGETGISATLEATSPLSSMYEYWDVPPQASFTIPDVTFLVSGKKQQCYNKISFTRYEKCKEDRSYTFFDDVYDTTDGYPLDAVVSFPDVLYVFSRNLVFYVKKTSSEKDQNVVYTVTQKEEVNDPADWNKWTNIPSGYTAITMVDEKIAVVFTGNKYHLYDTATKSILTEGFLNGQSDGNTECKTVKPSNKEPEATKQSNTESEAMKPTNTESEAVKPTNSESEAVKPSNSEPEAAKPSNSESEAVKPSNSESEAVKPSNSESEAMKPTNSESEAVKPTNSESEAIPK